MGRLSHNAFRPLEPCPKIASLEPLNGHKFHGEGQWNGVYTVEAIRTAIVDGDPVFREQVRELLKHEPDIEVVAECLSVRQASQLLPDRDPDLVVLYMDFPDKPGLGFLDAFEREKRPKLLCVAPTDRFAARAFDFAAVDFVLKQSLPARLPVAINRVRRRLLLEMADTFSRQASKLMLHEQTRPSTGRYAFKSGTHTVFIDLERLEWIEAQRDYALLHIGRDAHCIRRTMSQLEGELDPNLFVRIHRSTIVNLKHVSEIHKGKARLTLSNGTELRIGNGYRRALAHHCFSAKLRN